MKTLLKVVGALVAVVVVLIVAAAIVVPMVLDPAELKDRLVTEVRDKTGRELKIAGDVGVSVFPWLGVDVGKVELGNAPGFDAPFFARTDLVSVHVKLLPLLSRRVEMSKVVVHGLALNLARNKAGKSNWADLESAGGAAPAGGGGGGGEGLAALAIGGLDIRDARVSWDDRASGQKITVDGLSLKTGEIALGQPVDFKLGFGVALANPKITGKVDASASLAIDAGAQRVEARGLTAKAALEGPTLPGGKATIELGADVGADGAAKSVAVRNLKLSALGLAASGELSARAAGKGHVEGRLAVAEFSPRALVEALGQSLPPMSDKKALTRATFETSIGGTPAAIRLDGLKIGLDDSTITGKVAVGNFSAPLPSVDFTLALDAIDADRYLPPPAEGKPAAASPGAAAAPASGLPLDKLRALDVDGAFTAGRIKVAKLTVTDVDAKISAHDGLIRVHPVGAKLYQGTYAGDIRLDARKDTPQLALDERLDDVQAGPLLKDLAGEERLTGKSNVAAKVNAKGVDADAIKRTLNGDASFRFTDGALKGVNIARMIREAKAKIQGKTLPPEQGEVKTDFTEVSGTVKIHDGLASNDDFSAKSPLLRISGKGTANLPTEALDYRVRAEVVATTKGQGGKELQDLAGVPIPIHVTGTFAKPSYGLDVQALAGALAKSKAAAVVEQQKSKITEQIQKKAGGGAGGGLGGALKGLLGQ